MSQCKRKEEVEVYVDNNICANHDNVHMKRGSVVDSHFCLCRNTNEGCFIPTDCNTFQPTNAGTVSACLPYQCIEEMEWNCYTPPKPSCRWLNNFCELRRQWSNHARRQKCKCCNCKQRINITDDVMNPVSVSNTTGSTPHKYIHTCNNGWKKKKAYFSLLSYIGSIGYTTLIPRPLALVSFTLLIFIIVALSSALIIYQHYSSSLTCLRYSN